MSSSRYSPVVPLRPLGDRSWGSDITSLLGRRGGPALLGKVHAGLFEQRVLDELPQGHGLVGLQVAAREMEADHLLGFQIYDARAGVPAQGGTVVVEQGSCVQDL